ncbi:MAG: chromosome segregation protein SMC [Nodularia sp. (in: Bacteria)]|nr:MAG: chromosome segregation protein SMC [Nodularia sp. (in: cyanobacteria)]
MLSKIRVQHYKSLFDTEVDLEPLTILIGPNGSGKSNICEALFVLSDFLQSLIANTSNFELFPFFTQTIQKTSNNHPQIESKFWHGKLDYLTFEATSLNASENTSSGKFQDFLNIQVNYPQRTLDIGKSQPNALKNLQVTRPNALKNLHSTSQFRNFLISNEYSDSAIGNALRKVDIYDFAPVDLSSKILSNEGMNKTGEGIVYALVDILHTNRKHFDELEERLKRLVPNIQRILLPRGENKTFLLELIDRYSEHHIPAADISDGTLRILAFLTALYQENTPSIICFEEIENGVHPWLLHKMIELLKIVSTEGIAGKPVQILITTHSPVLLNYVEPHQVRAVELDNEGKTQFHALPTDSKRFQKAMEAYDGALGDLWFTNVFGGNPV